jgi:hypothetical protein
MCLFFSASNFLSTRTWASSIQIVNGSTQASFGIDTKVFANFIYGPNLPIHAIIFSHLYVHTSLGNVNA